MTTPSRKQEYEDRLEGLVLFDPLPFDGIENIDDLTLREAAVWGCVYSIQETQGSFDNYNTDPDTEQLLLPSVDVDAYLAKLVGPSFKLTHKSFEMDDMTVAFDETTQCYKIPVTGSGGHLPRYRHQSCSSAAASSTLPWAISPPQSSDDSILNNSSDTPTKYMDYLFSRQSGSWYLTGLTDSETKPESADSAASAAEPAPLAESEVNDAILATAGDSAANSVAASAVADEAAPVEEAAESTPAESTEASSESPAA
ncbi:MAG: Ice-structuring protein [Faecalibacterium sp.]